MKILWPAILRLLVILAIPCPGARSETPGGPGSGPDPVVDPLPVVSRMGPRVQLGTGEPEPPPAPWSWESPAKTRPPAPSLHLPAPDLAPLLAEDRERAGREKESRRIGFHREFPTPVDVGFGKRPGSGWSTLPDGRRVWATVIASEEAVGLRLHLEDVDLPEGAEFAVFDPRDPARQGLRHDRASLGGRREFWTGTVFASAVLLECRLPAGTDPSAVRFRVTSLLHRYVKLVPGDPGAKQAGLCEEDVMCRPEWALVAQAVAGLGVVQSDGELFCTGCLVNDASPEVGTDYLLTANHCVGSQVEADDTEFYWFYQTTACNGPEPDPAGVPRTTGGAAFVAGALVRFANDFALLRLRRPPPAGTVFAGWTDAPPAPGETVTCIHHPDGDFKRISRGGIASSDRDFWTVIWDTGVTEPGSSGSPLFNAAGEVIGQLYGGTSSCADPLGPDDYGRFDRTLPVIGAFLRAEPVGVANDAFATPTAIGGASGKVDGNTAGATREVGEPLHGGNAGGFSVWFEWTAAAAGPVTFETAGSGFDTLLGVYRGDTFDALDIVAANDDGGTPPASRVTFEAEAGGVYRVAVDGYDGAAGLYTLLWKPGGDLPAGEANDRFGDARELSGPRGDASGFNLDARNEPGEPAHAGAGGGASLWFVWTAPATGPVVFDTEGSDFDTVLAAYTGSSLGSLSEVASNDDTPENVQSRIRFTATAGTAYHIAVDGYGDGFGDVETGFVLLTWYPERFPEPVPANDDFADARSLLGLDGSVPVTNRGATREPDEPRHFGTDGGASVWFRWTAPGSGLVTFETTGADFDTVLAAYSGSALTGLVPLDGNDDIDIGRRSSRITLPTVLGGTYLVAVQGYETGNGDVRVGDFPLTWSYRGGAGRNDDFADAERLDGPAGLVRGRNGDATREAAEPPHAGMAARRSVWFRWIAPADGPVVFDTLGSTFDTVLAVYRGNLLGSLTEEGSNDDIDTARSGTRSRVGFVAVGGTEYRIVVDGFGEAPGGVGSIQLNWLQDKAPDLVLGRPTWTASAGFVVTATGVPSTGVVLQRKVGWLDDWVVVTDGVIPVSGQLTMADPAATGLDSVLYRAVTLPPP